MAQRLKSETVPETNIPFPQRGGSKNRQELQFKEVIIISTKIYTGFYLDAPIDAALPVLKDIKATLEPMMQERAKDAMCRRLATLCINVLNGEGNELLLPMSCSEGDKEYLECLLGSKEGILAWAANLVYIWAKTSEGPYSPGKDYAEDCNVYSKVVLFPFEKKTYGIAFGPQAFTDALLNMPQVHDFRYWNNTDKPSGISDADWEARGAIWQDILPSFWIDENGYTYTLFKARRFQFNAPKPEEVGIWLTNNRAILIRRRTEFLLWDKISKTFPQQELTDIDYFLELQKRAKKEIQNKTNLSAWAITKAAGEVPSTYDEVLALLK